MPAAVCAPRGKPYFQPQAALRFTTSDRRVEDVYGPGNSAPSEWISIQSCRSPHPCRTLSPILCPKPFAAGPMAPQPWAATLWAGNVRRQFVTPSKSRPAQEKRCSAQPAAGRRQTADRALELDFKRPSPRPPPEAAASSAAHQHDAQAATPPQSSASSQQHRPRPWLQPPGELGPLSKARR